MRSRVGELGEGRGWEGMGKGQRGTHHALETHAVRAQQQQRVAARNMQYALYVHHVLQLYKYSHQSTRPLLRTPLSIYAFLSFLLPHLFSAVYD